MEASHSEIPSNLYKAHGLNLGGLLCHYSGYERCQTTKEWIFGFLLIHWNLNFVTGCFGILPRVIFLVFSDQARTDDVRHHYGVIILS